jgi:ABC-type proline/glycine betaine transport system permease subunit
LISIPRGLSCSRNATAAHVFSGICDLLQTFPSFIYFPVIMLLNTSDFSNVIAMLF